MKKMFFMLRTASLLVMLFCFGQCRKEKDNHVGLSITLYDKSLDTIQFYIQGKWRLHYMYGGICGTCKYNREGYNEYYEFKNNTKIIYTYQNSISVDTTYSWITYQANPSDYIHKIIEYYDNGTVPYHFEINKIVNDTLIMAQPFLNSPDYMLYFLTK
jgi:hypothetical protein